MAIGKSINVPVIGGTPVAAAALVIGALIFLVAVERGFRGIKLA